MYTYIVCACILVVRQYMQKYWRVLHGPLVVHGRGLPEGATEVGPIRDAKV